MITNQEEARLAYIKAYYEVLRAEISYNISRLYLDQISDEITEGLGTKYLNKIKEEIKRWEDDD